MGETNVDTKKVLWDNISLLMKRKWGEENLNKLAREAKIGTGTASRLKDQETSVGLEVVEKVAKLFRVPPFSLLMPPDKDLLTILEAYSVGPKAREYLMFTANGALKEHGRDQAGEADSA